jgi:hypothetical protein
VPLGILEKLGEISLMIVEKEKIEKLIERVDELILLLNKISEDLRSVSGSIKSLAVSQITQPVAQTATVHAVTVDKNKTIQDVRMAFPEELENMLSIEEKEDYIMIKPKGFLGSENFAKIASTVRGLGGEYISAGRDSHFRVYKRA